MIYDQYADVNGHLYDSSKFCNVVSSLPTRRGGCCSNVSKINTLQVLPYGVAALCPLDRAFFTYYSAYIKICQLEVLAIHHKLQSVSLPHCHMFEERSTQEAKGVVDDAKYFKILFTFWDNGGSKNGMLALPFYLRSK